MSPGHPTEPKTAIARSLQPFLSDRRITVVATRALADALSDWLTEEVNGMEVTDPRIGGFLDLADRLTVR